MLDDGIWMELNEIILLYRVLKIFYKLGWPTMIILRHQDHEPIGRKQELLYSSLGTIFIDNDMGGALFYPK